MVGRRWGPRRLTYGLELEWADVDRWAELPIGTWATTDNTIVNSDGHANSPDGSTWRWGGEINTVPTDTTDGQVVQARVLAEILRPTINYRCNLHVHVGVDPIDVDFARHLLRFVDRWQDDVFALVDPIPKPTRDDYPDPEHYKGAMTRYRRRLVSHQYRLPAARVDEALAATTLDEFFDAHAPPNRSGGRSWHLAPRPGINLRSLRKHGTIEFRHWPGSADPDEIADALLWCQRFVHHAMYGTDPTETYRQALTRPWRFPTFRPYDHNLELGYRATKADR